MKTGLAAFLSPAVLALSTPPFPPEEEAPQKEQEKCTWLCSRVWSLASWAWPEQEKPILTLARVFFGHGRVPWGWEDGVLNFLLVPRNGGNTFLHFEFI